MSFMDIYKIGRAVGLNYKIGFVDKKVDFVLFPYRGSEIVNTSFLFFILGLLLYVVLSTFSMLFSVTAVFFCLILGVVLYIYPTSIYYSQRLVEYSEEMIKATMRISTYLLMGTSIDYAFIHTTQHLRGTLRKQFEDIEHMLVTKSRVSLGDAIAKYMHVWNERNPIFSKSLRLLQTAAMSPKKEMESIIRETIESMMMNYHIQGKRSSEELASKAQKLVTLGVLVPVMSLMLLPLLSTFLPDLITAGALIFFYNILLPTVTLIAALNFASRRLQVDTIHIESSRDYKKMSSLFFLIPIILAIVSSLPAILHILTIPYGDADLIVREYEFASIIKIWIAGAGAILAVWLYTWLYERKYRKLWGRVHEIESDLPYILQSFATYLGMNLPVENIIPEVVEDYKKFGFSNHSTVVIFERIMHMLATTKMSIVALFKKEFIKICPSKKVVDILNQIISFSDDSQDAAARAARLVREQVQSLFKLDDYLKTMLSDAVSLIGTAISMLTPLLCATAIIMGITITKSLRYITEQLSTIMGSFGGDIALPELVKIENIIPPTIIEYVVSYYLIEMILVLSVFLTYIKIGNDKYQVVKNIKENLLGFWIYSVILLGGVYMMNEFLFKGILGGG